VRLATIRTPAGTAAVRLEPEGAVHLGAADVGALLADETWAARAAGTAGETFPLESLDFAPLVPRPEKIICVGLNYRNHILEMGHGLPSHPTLFAKYPPTLIGANDDIVLPAASDAVDWEAELAMVVGTRVRHAGPDEAAAAIAGATVLHAGRARGSTTSAQGTGRTGRRNSSRANASRRPRPSAPPSSPPTRPVRTAAGRSAAMSTTSSCRSPTPSSCCSSPSA
jgi:2-keto-4-pentenoate hydratase/2-oxohepta-3-ene-1,7-dioic acid hydratase in catechol pathway